MQKKGQLTIFILLGAVFIIAVGLVLYTQGMSKEQKMPASLRPVAAAFQNCFKQSVAETAVTQLAQGGSLSPVNAAVLPPLLVQVVVDKDGVYVPSVEDMESDLDANLPRILSECKAFAQQSVPGAMIGDAEITVESTYIEAGLVTRIIAPYPMTMGSVSGTLSEQVVSLDMPYVISLRRAAQDIAEGVLTTGGLPLQTIASMPYTVNTAVAGFGYTIISLGSGGGIFNIAVLEPGRDSAPVILSLPETFIAGKDRLNQYFVRMNDIAEVSTNLGWVTITPQGEIIIDTRDQTEGSYSTEVTATDNSGNVDHALLRVVVQ
jgi:hypothetical protein